ncbi:signal transduction histidine kinase [Kitasatospora sp. GAS204A]|uniref:sensor histidine kinase n=1 Tax=unclassified Kitasatospora TaxID=2633591 RepID=UPI0024741672|nr:histidine kinase [Kitasatospora sp. GAS204B]MDH6119868.1 signal transduction histidine kinase [Kitasatospora sp. GAS204B]
MTSATTAPTAFDGDTGDPIWGHPLVAGLMRVCRRLQRSDRARPWLLDATLVTAVLLLFGLPDLLHGENRPGIVHANGLPVGAVVGLQLGLALPLLWRRRRPTAVFAAIAAVFVAQWSLNVWLHADIALFLALYSVARHDRLRRLPWVGAATAAALLLAAARVSVVISPLVALFFLCCTATAAAALGLALRVGTAYLAALRERAARLEIERDQRSRLAAATERTRVAREMHDIIGHNLSVIIGLADGGAYAAEVAPQRSKEALQLIAGTGRQALGELRRMLGVLREERTDGPELTPQPGVADLAALCARVRAAGPEVTYRTVGDVEALDRGLQLTVYRIAQEALTNTLKHAGPETSAKLTLRVTDREIRIRIEDSGRASGAAPATTGLDANGNANGDGSGDGDGQGITGMKERATLYGGRVTAGRRPGGGWTVEAVLDPAPLGQPAAPTTVQAAS